MSRTPGEESLHERLRPLVPAGDVAQDRSPLVLAYVGDAVFEVAVRAYLAARSASPVSNLHERASVHVRASAQARALERIEHLLTEEERDVVRRARNAKGHVPRSATVAEYRYSTAFEALIGYLFLRGELDRLVGLLRAVITDGEAGG